EFAMPRADHPGPKDVRHARLRALEPGVRVRGSRYLLLGSHNVLRKQELGDLTHVLGFGRTTPTLNHCGSYGKFRDHPVELNLLFSTAPRTIPDDDPFLVGRGHRVKWTRSEMEQT